MYGKAFFMFFEISRRVSYHKLFVVSGGPVLVLQDLSETLGVFWRTSSEKIERFGINKVRGRILSDEKHADIEGNLKAAIYFNNRVFNIFENYPPG